MLLLNLILALVWMALRGTFTPADFLVGFLFGFAIIALTQRTLGRSEYGTKTWRVLKFIAFSFWSIIKSNIFVARVVLAPRLNIDPGIVAVPLDVRSDLGITILANLMTLTPGTISVDVSSDKRTLYIHFMDVTDPEAVRREIKQEFERRVMELVP